MTVIHFARDNMAPLMFVGMILFMLIGYPAAFSLAAYTPATLSARVSRSMRALRSSAVSTWRAVGAA